MFIVIFIIVKSRNNPNIYQLMEVKKKKKYIYIHEMKYYLAMERNEVLIYDMIWMKIYKNIIIK